MKKRLRIFAGPNGSGKSTIIKKILETEVSKGRKLDFGTYINADDIAVALHKKGCKPSKFRVDFNLEEFTDIANASGLINKDFPLERFSSLFRFDNGSIVLEQEVLPIKDDLPIERLAQIIADYLRKKLLESEEKFSFETVFSHHGKVDFIRQATDNGYKVYLYFVSTEDPDINVFRVKKVRVAQKGHDVELDKIIKRYYRSMDFMFEAAQLCYQCYFFDNSEDDFKHSMFAHFKKNAEGDKDWDSSEPEAIPNWFKKYYSAKVIQSQS